MNVEVESGAFFVHVESKDSAVRKNIFYALSLLLNIESTSCGNIAENHFSLLGVYLTPIAATFWRQRPHDRAPNKEK